MALEILIFAPTREQFIAGMRAIYLPDGRPLVTLTEEGDLLPVEGIYIDEIGAVVRVEAQLGSQGEILEPAQLADGYHVNVLVTGEVERLLTAGLPQTAENGSPLGLFERTRILGLILGLEWEATSIVGEPPGYVGQNGVKVFDPALVKNRRRVWFGVD